MNTDRNSQPTQATAEVVVSTDPETAFRLFIDDIATWWVPGPINFFHADRSPRMQIEPRLGGRVLERYRDDVLVIAEITTFQPGTRLDLCGVVDDSMTEIHFLTDPAGTRIRVHAYLRPGGQNAFLFWPNVIGWLANYAGNQPASRRA